MSSQPSHTTVVFVLLPQVPRQVTPQGPSARHPDTGCSSCCSSPFSLFDSMLRWNKQKEVQYALLCDPSSPHYCQMATYLWKEVSTNIDLHVSEKHKVVEKQECFQFQEYNKYAASQTRLFTNPGTAQRNSRQRPRTLSHPPLVGSGSDTGPSAQRTWHHSLGRDISKMLQFQTLLRTILSWKLTFCSKVCLVQCFKTHRRTSFCCWRRFTGLWSQHRHNNTTPGCGLKAPNEAIRRRKSPASLLSAIYSLFLLYYYHPKWKDEAHTNTHA